MDVEVKLKAALPKGAANGLSEIAEKLGAEPGEIRAAVVLFKVAQLVTDVATDEVQAHIALLRFEPIVDREDAAVVARIIDGAYEARSGQTRLSDAMLEDRERAFFDEEGA